MTAEAFLDSLDYLVCISSYRRTYARPVRHKDGSCRLVQWTVWADSENRLVYAIGRVQGNAPGE